MPTALIEVFRRPNVWVDRNALYGVYLDGQRVADLWSGQVLTVPVSTGTHRVQIRAAYLRSKEVTVDVSSMERARLTCTAPSPPIAVVTALIRWRSYMTLRLMSQEESDQLARRDADRPKPRDLRSG